jgi:hypothetical protein
MNTLRVLTIGVCLLLSAGCTTTRHAAKKPGRPTPAASAAANVLIISAVYGSGAKFDDVTYRVNDLVHQPEVEFFARPEWLATDPTPGWNKALVIVYEFKGQRRTFTTGEGGRVSAEILIEAATH